MIRNSALLWVLLSNAAAAQTRPAWDGAFTAAQADRGRAAYRESCARCHGPELAGGESTPPLAGSAFLAQWSGKSALELLDRTRRTMPTDNPAGLERAAVCRHRGLPARRQPLPCRRDRTRRRDGAQRSRGVLPNGATTAATPAARNTSPLGPDQRFQREQAAYRLVVESEEFRTVGRIQLGSHAPDGGRPPVRHRRARGATRSRSTPRPARLCGCTGSMKGRAARRWRARTIAAWRIGVRERRTHPADLARLPIDCARRPHRPRHSWLRQGRHRRSLGGSRPRRGQAGRDRLVVARHRGARRDRGRRGPASRHCAALEEERPRLHPRVRRPHRQAALDLPHHSAARRVRPPDLGETVPGSTPATPAHGVR